MKIKKKLLEKKKKKTDDELNSAKKATVIRKFRGSGTNIVRSQATNKNINQASICKYVSK